MVLRLLTRTVLANGSTTTATVEKSFDKIDEDNLVEEADRCDTLSAPFWLDNLVWWVEVDTFTSAC